MTAARGIGLGVWHTTELSATLVSREAKRAPKRGVITGEVNRQEET